MKLGVVVRNMGPQSTTEGVVACARAAEQARLDDLWVVDHLAIPPDDAEGSAGRYLDPLATLAFLAGKTEHIGLGTGVLVLPYRPALPTAKWVASIQELSEGRLRLGVGIGWMRPEFRALGVPRRQRGRISDETLATLQRCFERDEVELNGQHFLFRPRPTRPPIYVGGAPPHAFRRALRFGDGWMPMGGDAAALAPQIAELRELADAEQRPRPEVVLMTSLPVGDPEAAVEQALGLGAVGVDRLVHGWRYAGPDEFRRHVDVLADPVRPALAAASP